MTIICNLRLFLAHFLPFMLPVASDIDVKNVFFTFCILIFYSTFANVFFILLKFFFVFNVFYSL